MLSAIMSARVARDRGRYVVRPRRAVAVTEVQGEPGVYYVGRGDRLAVMGAHRIKALSGLTPEALAVRGWSVSWQPFPRKRGA